jgi:hypothetical protein
LITKVDSGAHRRQHVLPVPVHRQQHEARPRRHPRDLLRGDDPVHLRHVEVQHRDARLRLACVLHGLEAVAGGTDDRESLALQQREQAVADHRVIVREQHADGLVGAGFRSRPRHGAGGRRCFGRAMSVPAFGEVRMSGAIGETDAAPIAGVAEIVELDHCGLPFRLRDESSGRGRVRYRSHTRARHRGLIAGDEDWVGSLRQALG